MTPTAFRDHVTFVKGRGYRLTTVRDELGAPGTMFLTLDTLGMSGRLAPSDAGRLGNDVERCAFD